MKTILLSDFKDNMGTFIDINYTNSNVVAKSVHIPYENLLVNHRELLKKDGKYFIYCNGGIKSRKAVNILQYYGYDVTLVVKK